METSEPVVAAHAATAAANEAWQMVAQFVWDDFVQRVEVNGRDSRDIWRRQVDAFWEMAWAVGGSGELARRKLWRLPLFTVEPGDHCLLMPAWQELSGHVAATKAGRDRQRKFWAEFRVRLRSNLDVDALEQLCAIALIKRLYPAIERRLELFGDAFGQRRFWASTADVAVSRWREHILLNPELKAEADSYAADVARARNLPGAFEDLDGNFFISTALEEPARLRISENDVPRLKSALEKLHESAGEPPSSYAIIRADGDRVGAALAQLRSRGDQVALEALSERIAEFGTAAPVICEQHKATCVYAGGDDVLALCDVQDALGLADSLATSFCHSVGANLTLSVAVHFVQFRLPLRDVLADSHRLLDDIAKDAVGRDALAINLHLSSGLAAEFAAPWSWWREESTGFKRLDLLPKIGSNRMAGANERGQSFTYKIAALGARLGLGESVTRKPGTFVDLGDLADTWPNLVYAERLVGREGLSKARRDEGAFLEIRRDIDTWLSFTHRVRRTESRIVVDRNFFSLDGPRIATFLSGVTIPT
jgi:CRISPR-associated protein Cmr2